LAEGAELCVEGVVIRSVSCLPIRPPMLLVCPGLKVPEGLDREGSRPKIGLRVWVPVELRTPGELPRFGVVGTLGEGLWIEGEDRHSVGGVRAPERIDGLGLGELGWLGRLNEGCLWIVGLLRDGAVNDRLGIEGVAGADRLKPGDGLRVGALLKEELLREPSEVPRSICILGCEGMLIRGLTDRLGAVDGRDMKPRLLCEGMVRCGIDREIDGADRLGADGVVCRLLPELRCVRCASAAEANNSAAITAIAAPTAAELNFFFIENIIDLLSPTACSSGNPGLPFPHRRRHPTRVVRSVWPLAQR
jgi:hypothetical protein